jgi:hypothetical protein
MLFPSSDPKESELIIESTLLPSSSWYQQAVCSSSFSNMAPKLEHAFTMRGYMSQENSVDLKAIKSGPYRIIVPITHGFLRGSGLEATLLPGGGDWILVGVLKRNF